MVMSEHRNGREGTEWNKPVLSSGHTIEIIYLVSLFLKTILMGHAFSVMCLCP